MDPVLLNESMNSVIWLPRSDYICSFPFHFTVVMLMDLAPRGNPFTK